MADLPALLQPGDALVFNDTRVIPARLEGEYHHDGVVVRIGATLHMRTALDGWKAFVRPAKRLQRGGTIIFSGHGIELVAAVAEKGDAGEILLIFDKSGMALDAAIKLVGRMPLPPYIAARRAEDAQDRIDYQTVYAREEGAVAAPTAGLHFTIDLLKKLAEHGIEEHFITLHVGAGTFLPVRVDDTENHKMHAEIGHIDAETAERLMAVKAQGGQIIAVGTTTLRLLESATSEIGQLGAWSGATDIFITPGYQFRFVDRLITNFHLPRSTLFMLVSAFSGLETMKAAYKHAIENDYRFYSYGDASLLDRFSESRNLALR
ncbi:MAG: S-adenosylmethionine:tRNA ribosyltransferase-isomerase [Candidatus Tokpelaia sp. JSC189]|nr:MAG: S-adenosylmethionine:tRNA ribosyltransferase-isomerase [Candidatus Tokpelaia sp. JSC189]